MGLNREEKAAVIDEVGAQVASAQSIIVAEYRGLEVGSLIYGISKDPVSAAKVLSDFAKGNDKLALKAGAMPNTVLDQNGVKALASMPSRDELLAQLMGTMQAPVAKFVRTLNEVPGKFVRTVAALRDEREKAGA